MQGVGKSANYDPTKDTTIVPPHPPKARRVGRRWDRGGINAYSGGMHKTETVDYAIMLDGERTLVLDDCEVEMEARRHRDRRRRVAPVVEPQPRRRRIAFDMIAAKFVDGPVGLAQGNDKVLVGDPQRKLPDGVKPARRIVCMDREPWKSTLVSDGPSPDVRTDPARPGFASQRMWVTEGPLAKIVLETLHLPHTIEPPAGGSVMRVVTLSAGRRLEGQGRRGGGAGVFPLDGIAGRFDLLAARAAPLHAEDAHAGIRHRAGRRDRAGARHAGSHLKAGDFVDTARQQPRVEQPDCKACGRCDSVA